MSGDQWRDLARRVALEISHARYYKLDLCVTSYDKTTHTVKGMIVPHNIETGDIPIHSIQTSGDSGTGVFIGATPGDASALTNGEQFMGDVMEVHFDGGDPNTMIAHYKMSQPENPPQVESGEMLHQHQKGSTHLYKQDGTVIFTHFAKQGTQTWNTDGSITTDTKGAAHTVMTGGGATTIDSGGGTQTFTAKSHSFSGDMNVTGKVTAQGDITSASTVQGSTGVFPGGTTT